MARRAFSSSSSTLPCTMDSSASVRRERRVRRRGGCRRGGRRSAGAAAGATAGGAAAGAVVRVKYQSRRRRRPPTPAPPTSASGGLPSTHAGPSRAAARRVGCDLEVFGQFGVAGDRAAGAGPRFPARRRLGDRAANTACVLRGSTGEVGSTANTWLAFEGGGRPAFRAAASANTSTSGAAARAPAPPRPRRARRYLRAHRAPAPGRACAAARLSSAASSVSTGRIGGLAVERLAELEQKVIAGGDGRDVDGRLELGACRRSPRALPRPGCGRLLDRCTGHVACLHLHCGHRLQCERIRSVREAGAGRKHANPLTRANSRR